VRGQGGKYHKKIGYFDNLAGKNHVKYQISFFLKAFCTILHKKSGQKLRI